MTDTGIGSTFSGTARFVRSILSLILYQYNCRIHRNSRMESYKVLLKVLFQLLTLLAKYYHKIKFNAQSYLLLGRKSGSVETISRNVLPILTTVVRTVVLLVILREHSTINTEFTQILPVLLLRVVLYIHCNTVGVLLVEEW